MKTLRLIGMALFAFLMCGNFISCSNEDVKEISQEQELKYVNVGLKHVGEFLTTKDTPLESRANESAKDIYGFKVYTINEDESTTAYAYGLFSSLDNVSIKLAVGHSYYFKTTILADICECTDEEINDEGHQCETGFLVNIGTDFNYNTQNMTHFTNFETIGTGASPEKTFKSDRYYGELSGYEPEQGSEVSISTKRTVYGAHYIVEGLTEGSLRIQVSNDSKGNLYTVDIPYSSPESNGIYSFYEVKSAWQSLNNYTATKYLNITLINGEKVTPLGTYEVTFKRNVKTTITIKAGDMGFSNGLDITKEEGELDDDENEFIIEDGVITEQPIEES